MKLIPNASKHAHALSKLLFSQLACCLRSIAFIADTVHLLSIGYEPKPFLNQLDTTALCYHHDASPHLQR
jgi:hypothetical protein